MVAALALGAGLLAACGSDGDDVDEVGAGTGVDGPAQTVPIGGEDPTLADDGIDPGDEVDPVTAELDITAGVTDDEGSLGQASLSCGPEGAMGVLWLEGAAAEAACDALGEPSVLAQLDPPDPEQVCTEIYGGAEVATIVGTVEGLQFDAVVRRTDGCGIARWDALAPLLPPVEGAGPLG